MQLALACLGRALHHRDMKTTHKWWIVVLLVILGIFGLWYVSHAPGTDLLVGSDTSNVYEPKPIPDTTNEVPDVNEPDSPDKEPDMVFCTMDAKQCPDGSYVGRSGPDCEFAACPDTTPVPVESGTKFCPEIYQPVCAQVQVECITTPCNPVSQTFSNGCFADIDSRVISYDTGACEEQ